MNKISNPFEIIENRLTSIEKLLHGLSVESTNDDKAGVEDTLLTVPETAELLNLTVPTIYSKVSRGELPYMKNGKQLYFSKKDIFDQLRKSKRKSTEEIRSEANQHFLKNNKHLNR